MASDRSMLERQMERVQVPPFTLEGFHRRRQRKQRNRRVGTAFVGLAVAVLAIGGLLRTFSSRTDLAGDPRTRFLGTWYTTDADGSTPTMAIRASGGGGLEIVVHDDRAPVCSGGPSTMTGTGRLEGETRLLIPSPALTCDDGSQPQALDGPPLEEQLRNLTFVHDPRTDTLTDSSDSLWGKGQPQPCTPPADPESLPRPGCIRGQQLPETEVARGVYGGTPWQLNVFTEPVIGVDHSEGYHSLSLKGS
ncbi:MAG TPA: hypothetical protein VEA19_00380, partial [Actinomycetota bacterium]|nr:hypothetical protein [Actinomycetota bacterium]